MMHTRATVGSSIELTGVGLFTAKPALLRILPRPEGGGLAFRCRAPGVATPIDIDASVSSLIQLPGLPGRNTVLGKSVQGPMAITTEHVLSACVGLGVTDAVLELEGPEVPMFDGSALPFAEAILRAGVVPLESVLEPLSITATVEVRGPGGARLTATPRSDPGCSYAYTLEYAGMPGAEKFALQTAEWDGTPEQYLRDVAPARTFCLVPEAMALRQAGLFLHVTPREMLVLNLDGSPVENTLRFPTEPARHKLLDLIGDLALVGRPIQADITAVRGGHALNHELARELLQAAV